MMIYFDTDVLVHFVINQDLTKHNTARQLVIDSAEKNILLISYLSLNEFAFVLSKLKVDKKLIDSNLDVFLASSPKEIDQEIFQRARIFAKNIGYGIFSDCVHTAIAEKYCTELFTFNKNDFKKIKRFTDLKINIL